MVVNQQGRPVEFLCTEPVTLSRAEEILYGATLRADLFGSRIVPALFAQLAEGVDVVLAEDQETLGAARDAGGAIGLVTTDEEGRAVVALQARAHLAPEANARLAQLAESIELDEPFDRVRLAMEEAHRVGQDPTSEEADAAKQ